MPRPFWKLEGLGNDFVLLDERERDQPSVPVAARSALCDRHRGVGADGVLTVLRSRVAGAVARMHLTNADGSVAEMCGNGLRCVSLFLCTRGTVRAGEPHVVDTDAGARGATVLEAAANDAGAQGAQQVKVDMGPARFEEPSQFAVASVRTAHGREGWLGTTVSMGNPHVVLEVAELPPLDVAATMGAAIERDARYPQRTNVEWAKRAPDGSLDVVVWERGVGLTQACGTGACAVAAAFAKAGLVPYDVDVTVRLPGGPLAVRVPADGGALWMTGPARLVFEGTLPADV
ncbi:MAG: diaminopimelate epimerase [Deltaproteobacteria bacterium RBG_16_71_12]|nr:MAG: diaminopimelate epimerase [Deltaproteobacteria bacterium RBG_16_71_12]